MWAGLLVSENLTRRNEFTNGRLLLWPKVSQQAEAWEDTGKEQELDRCHAEAALQWGFTVPDNYGYCQETYLAIRGRDRGRQVYYETCHPPPIGTISFIHSIKDNQGCPASPEIKRDGDYENNNSFLNYLNVLKETLFLTVLNTCKQEGKKQKQTRRPQ